MMNIMKAVAGRQGAAKKTANTLTGGVGSAIQAVAGYNPLMGSAQSTVQAAMGYNPGFKPSGAPMPFSPAAQNTMTSAFGMPMENLYDRAMSVPQQPPIGVETPMSTPQQPPIGVETPIVPPLTI
jgi:hypothetical protein